MIPAGYATYSRTVQTTVENKEEILLILFDNVVTAVKKARMGVEDKNPKLKGENISQVFAIITELDCALDHEKGGDIAENLSALYRYIMDRLTVANVKNDLNALGEVERLLVEIQEGFKTAGAQQKEAAKTTSPRQIQGESTERLSVAV